MGQMRVSSILVLLVYIVVVGLIQSTLEVRGEKRSTGSTVLVPMSVEIRLVGLQDIVKVESLQQSLDSLSTTDVQLFPMLQLGLSYTVRHYDQILSESTLVQSKTPEGLARAEEVDQQIQSKHEAFRGFVIYILNFKANTNDSISEPTPKRRAYASDPAGGGDDYCSTQVWVSQNDRFAWVDLAALEPISEYGPLLDGEGFVSFGRSVPKPEDFSQMSFHSRLAALCHRAALHLASPSPSHPHIFASPFNASIVRTFVITSFKNDRESEQVRARWEKNLLQPLRAATKVLNTNISFEVVLLKLDSCPVCAAAHELAIRVGERTDALDPQKLKEILTKRFSSATSLLPGSAEVFNMFVFKTESGPFLFEGSKQAVWFDDCVLAIEGISSEISIPTTFKCRGENRVVTSDASDVTRLVLAGALRSVFGVSPTYERFSTALGRFTSDYLFAVGHTPFGPFSGSTRLSKSIRDAVWRNPVFAHLAKSLEIIFHLRQNIRGLKFSRREELTSLLDMAEANGKRCAVFIGLLDVEHAKEFAAESRKQALAASKIFSKLTFTQTCVPRENSDGDAGSESEGGGNGLEMSLIPFLLLIMAGAVVYETRISRMRKFIRDFPAQRGSIGGGSGFVGRDSSGFVAPAKKVD